MFSVSCLIKWKYWLQAKYRYSVYFQGQNLIIKTSTFLLGLLLNWEYSVFVLSIVLVIYCCVTNYPPNLAAKNKKRYFTASGVRNLNVSWLRGSGSGSLGRLQSSNQLVPQSSEGLTSAGELISTMAHAGGYWQQAPVPPWLLADGCSSLPCGPS